MHYPDEALVQPLEWLLSPGDSGGALIHLSVPIVGVTPAIVYSGEVEVGTHAYWSGYGLRGYYPSGETNISGFKMGGENIIDRIGWPLLGIQEQYMMADFGSAWGTPTLPLEMGGTNGDSGSGWFADINGQVQLIGLATLGRGQFSNTGVIRPAVYQDWIQSFVTPVPEPSTVALMISSLPLALCRMRRRRGIGEDSTA